MPDSAYKLSLELDESPVQPDKITRGLLGFGAWMTVFQHRQPLMVTTDRFCHFPARAGGPAW
jgi:hypothetical protein